MKAKKTASKTAAISTDVKPAFRLALAAFVVIVTFIFFAQKIYFVNADLGRHLENGKVFFQNWKPISTNYYSYTQPDFPVVNHHWGTGVLFYLIYMIFGFSGLSFFSCLISSITVLLFYLVAVKRSHPYLAALFFIICIPVIANRVEIRPEIFSMLLLSIYVFLFERYKQGFISFKSILITIPLLQLTWVNLHIFFVFGLFLIGVYGIGEVVNKKEGAIRNFSILLAIAVIACLINPAGINGALQPLSIFNNYAYMVSENQNVFFMQNRFGTPVFLHLEIVTTLVTVIVIMFLFTRSTLIKNYTTELLFLLVFTVLAFRAIRGLPLAGCFFLAFGPVLLFALIQGFNITTRKKNATAALVIFLILSGITIGRSDTYLSAVKPNTGLGLKEGIDNSAVFFNSVNIKGPIFNNYDIGGFLIFELFPQERVFVDNRPEAYSNKFFNEVYNPMLEKEEVWKKEDSVYHFNCIYFFRLDETQFGQPFLISRIEDRAHWAPVYFDEATLIFLKRNSQNKAVIDKYELPADIFSAK